MAGHFLFNYDSLRMTKNILKKDKTMKNTLKSIITISFVSMLLFGCGGGTSTGSGGGGSGGGGSVTFSGTGAADIIEGTAFNPGPGSIVEGPHPVFSNATTYAAAWAIPGAGSGDTTSITYTETIAAAGTSYVVSVSSGVHTPVFNFNNWTGFDGATQITGVSIDKATKTITFTDLTLAGSSGTTTTLILNGSLTAQ